MVLAVLNRSSDHVCGDKEENMDKLETAKQKVLDNLVETDVDGMDWLLDSLAKIQQAQYMEQQIALITPQAPADGIPE